MSGRAPYMEWAKTRPRPEVDLAGSNLLACTLDELPGAREAVDIEGEAPEGYPPLVEAIARHHGVDPSRVATAGGCSGATFLACAAILSPGDDVLVESPGYDPIAGAVSLLGARVRSFPRRFEDGYALDPDAVLARTGVDKKRSGGVPAYQLTAGLGLVSVAADLPERAPRAALRFLRR